MKKHFLRILVVMLMACLGIGVLAACGDGEEETPPETTYTVQFSLGESHAAEGVTAPASQTGKKVGDTVTLTTLNAAEDWKFDGWSAKSGKVSGTTYTVKAADAVEDTITLTAQWAEDTPAPTTYTVEFNAGTHGTVVGDATYTEKADGASITVPTVTANKGYTFSGWKIGTKAVSGTYTVAAADATSGKITITAEYTPITYTVNFVVTKPQGATTDVVGTVPTDTTITIENSTVTFPTVTLTGYNLTGWKLTNEPSESLKTGASYAVTAAELPANDAAHAITFTAQWAAEGTYTVSFNAGTHGTVVGDATFAEQADGASVTVPTVTANKGYTFSAWKLGNKTVSGNYTVSAADADTNGTITITAEYTPITYTVHFVVTKPQGATGEVEGTHADATITIEDNTVTFPTGLSLEGYDLTGWKLGSGNPITSTTYDVLETELPENDANHEITFTAQWSEIYTVTYGLGTHAASDATAIQPVTAHEADDYKVTLPAAPKAAEGWEFRGWQVGNELKDAEAEITVSADITVTARWKETLAAATSIEGVWTLVDGTVTTEITIKLSVDKETAEAIILTADLDPGYETYKIEYQELKKTEEGYAYTVEGYLTKTYTFKWDNGTLTMTTSTKMGASDPTTTTTTFTNGTELPGEAPTFAEGVYSADDGYANAVVNFNTLSMTAGDEIYEFTTKTLGKYLIIVAEEYDDILEESTYHNYFIYEDVVTYYILGGDFEEPAKFAQPIREEYTVSFKLSDHAADGATAPDSITAKDGDLIDLPTDVEVEDGYELKAWREKTGEHEFTDHPAGSKFLVRNNVELTAVIEPINYKLTFDKNKPADATKDPAGTIPPLVTVSIEERTVALPELSLEGYIFLGWKKDNTGDAMMSFTLTEEIRTALEGKEISFTAAWQKVEAGQFAITFDSNVAALDDTVKNTLTGMPTNTAAAAGGYTIPTEEPTCDGYTFKGWKVLGAEGNTIYKTGTANNKYTISAAVTFVAQWEKVTYTVTYEYGEGTAETKDPEQKEWGTKVDFPATPTAKAGYKFNGWKVKDAEGNNVDLSSVSSFTMPRANVTVTATWTNSSTPTLAKIDGTWTNEDTTIVIEGDKALVITGTNYIYYTLTADGDHYNATGKNCGSGDVEVTATFTPTGDGFTYTASEDPTTFTTKQTVAHLSLENVYRDAESAIEIDFTQKKLSLNMSVLTPMDGATFTDVGGYIVIEASVPDMGTLYVIVYKSEEKVMAWSSQGGASEITPYSEPEETEYTVKFYLEKGKYEGAATYTITVKEGETITAAEGFGTTVINPTKPYYTFAGWKMKKDETSLENVKAEANYAEEGEEHVIIVYADWTQVEALPSEQQTASPEAPIIGGNETKNYNLEDQVKKTGAQWIGKIQRGKKVTLTGTLESAAGANWDSPIAFLWSGVEAKGHFRTDSYVEDFTDDKSQNEGQPAVPVWNTFATYENWTIRIPSAPDYSIPNGDGKTKLMLSLVEANVTFVWDWIYDNMIRITITIAGKGAGVAGGTHTTIYDIAAVDANHPLKDEYSIGIASVYSYLQFTSKVDENATAVPEVSASEASGMLTLGTEGNETPYSPKLKTYSIEKGKKVTFSGTMTSNATKNWFGPLVTIYDGTNVFGVMRGDNYIIDGNFLSALNVLVENTTTVGDWATDFLPLIKDCNLTLTIDFSTENKVVVTMVFSKDENTKTQTYTLTAVEGKELPQKLAYDLGVELAYVNFTSIVTE